MISIETIAAIRDLSIIVLTGVAVIVLLMGGLSFYRLSRSVQRTARNVEAISEILLDSVARPLRNIPTILESGKNVLGWVQEYLSKDRRNEQNDDS
ncbi:MAG: hypothetical protein BZY80_01660 [SAR202 cluster bacterium Io17-Chloro-G2]|nr:MAG: hypothetical protein BZY80_01660 [SAR202 cluster bacterium Io17-Chloro-G2]